MHRMNDVFHCYAEGCYHHAVELQWHETPYSPLQPQWQLRLTYVH